MVGTGGGDDMSRKYKSYSYEEYKRAMELLEKGYGLTETCRILGWPETKKSTLYFWKHGRIPPVAKWKAEPSKELAYVIGVLHGDGNVSKSKNKSWYEYKVQLNTTDPEFTITFSKVMSRLLGVNYHEPCWSEKEKKWLVVYQSKAFYTWYKKTEEKGLEGFKSFIEYNRETVRYYLRGLYDSDGNNSGNKRIRLTNSKKELLEYVQYLLKKYFDIIATGPYLVEKAGSIMMINERRATRKHNCYEISIGKKLYVQKYLEKIGFSIVRKQLGLKKHEKVFVEGIGYVEPFKLVELGLFKLLFSDAQ